jgi:RNA polymerase sigma factor (sigma-70 family)
MLDNTKWTEIYNKHSKKMLWVCKRYVNDISLAEDLMHEGFILAMQKQNTFSGFGSFEGWLRTIMVNTSLMHLRKSKANLFVSDSDIPDNTPAITDMNSTYDSKSKIINTDFSQQELLDVVEAIPEHHKIVFNMYVIDNFSHNEIGKTLNITTNTSKSHLLRARKKIQELLLLKANEKEQKKDRRKLFFWFLFTSGYIDSIYAKGFSSQQESPSKAFNIKDVIVQQNLPEKITSGYIFGITLQKVLIATASIVVLMFAFFNFSNEKNKIYKDKVKVEEDTISNKKTANNQVNITSLQDSLKTNQTKESSTVKNKDLNNQTDEKASVANSEKTTDEGKKSPKKEEQFKKPHKNNQQKNPVVIKKIIDTVYVYK